MQKTEIWILILGAIYVSYSLITSDLTSTQSVEEGIGIIIKPMRLPFIAWLVYQFSNDAKEGREKKKPKKKK